MSSKRSFVVSVMFLSDLHLVTRYDEILPRVLAHGLTQANLDSCLTTYEQLSIWVVNYDRTSVRFLGY